MPIFSISLLRLLKWETFFEYAFCIYRIIRILQPAQFGLNVLTSSIIFDHTHHLHLVIVQWASKHLANGSQLKTAPVRPDDDEVETNTAPENIHGSVFSKRAYKTVRYEPGYGWHWFRHCERLFVFQRLQADAGRGRESETIILRTWGRNVEPIKGLISHILATNQEQGQHSSFMWIKRTSPWSFYYGVWEQLRPTPWRPVEAVAMSEEEKKEIIDEIEDYLRPQTTKWYAQMGVAKRRGYLFHGPPGTGKTSFALALAGHFSLDIYTVALGDSKLTDSDLSSMFMHLPRRCLVLVEDIDASDIGSSRAEDATTSGNPTDKSKACTLAGLFEAIDGITSAEGRVLVMTTNYPERLDDALVRSGRVDRSVLFPLLTADRAQQMFSWFFKNTEAAPDAHKFGALCPEGELAPADLQEFLVQNRNSALDVMERFQKWLEKPRRKFVHRESI